MLKMSQSVAKGNLWDHLYRNWAHRLVVVTTIDDLRRSQVLISRELSWEQTAQDLVSVLLKNPRVNALSHCAYTVVSLHTAGALLISNPFAGDSRKGAPRFTLFYDPFGIEQMWSQDYPGRMIGNTTCLAAGIARQLLQSPEEPCLEQGLPKGLRSMRRLHTEGYGNRGAPVCNAALEFPVELVGAELAKDEKTFSQIELKYPFQLEARRGANGGGSSGRYEMVRLF